MNIVVTVEHYKFSIQTNTSFIYLHSQNHYEDYTSRKTSVSSPQAKKERRQRKKDKKQAKLVSSLLCMITWTLIVVNRLK